MKDYDRYIFSFKELALYMGEGLLICSLFAYVFYRSIIAFFILLPIAFLWLGKKKRDCIKAQKEELSLEFSEMMSAVSTALEAGYSVENAFINSYKDMVMLYGKNAMISGELNIIKTAINNNRSIEDVLMEFAERSHIREIYDFAQIFKIAKRSGGNLPGIIRQTVDLILDKLEVERSIATMIHSKQFEQNIMNLVPFGIILYIDVTSRGFFDCLYGNAIGIIIMSVLVVVYLVAYYLAMRITDIRV